MKILTANRLTDGEAVWFSAERPLVRDHRRLGHRQ